MFRLRKIRVNQEDANDLYFHEVGEKIEIKMFVI